MAGWSDKVLDAKIGGAEGKGGVPIGLIIVGAVVILALILFFTVGIRIGGA